MSLLSECQALEGGYNGLNSYHVEEEIENVEKLEDEMTGDSRWSIFHRAVFKRGDEYVALDYETPATEYQEGGDFSHEFYVVEPYEVTVTKFRKVKA